MLRLGCCRAVRTTAATTPSFWQRHRRAGGRPQRPSMQDLDDVHWSSRFLLHPPSGQSALSSHLAFLSMDELERSAMAGSGAATICDQHVLHLAAWVGHVDVVKCLCKHKADVGAAAMDDTAAIHFASQKGHLEVVRELLASGASVKAKNRKGFTALHFASQNSHLELVKYLVRRGVDITTKTNAGQTALHVAENDDVRAFLKECEQSLKKGVELPSEKKDDSAAEKADDGKVSGEARKDGVDAGQGDKRKSEEIGAGTRSPEVKKAKVSLAHLENDMEEEEEPEK